MICMNYTKQKKDNFKVEKETQKSDEYWKHVDKGNRIHSFKTGLFPNSNQQKKC